jgi:hypothetical protein
VKDSSNSQQITVDISNFPEASNGGCDILSFDIQMDDGLGGSFLSKLGYITP